MIELAAVTERAEALARAVRAFRCGRARVRDFRLNYGEGRTATLGIHDSLVGSTYAPFQVSDGVRGSLFLAWQDGRVSRALLDGNVPEGPRGPELGALLESSHDARYRDDDARAFAAPARVAATPIFHRGIEALLEGRFGLLYDAIDLIRSRGRALRVKKISGAAQASIGASVVLTSRRLRYAALSTEFSFRFGYDSELWDGRSRRRAFSLAEIERVIDRAARLLPHLRREVKGAASGPARMLWLPGFASEMLETFVIGNLDGAEVATGQSAFKPEDFRRRRRVFRSDLELSVDPTVPFSSGSYRVTSEGLPARRQAYIEGGRLVRPVVGLKFARRLGIRPTTPPTSMESIAIQMGSRWSEARALAAMGEGFVVLSALGLHTQDPSSGDFSLTAPRALVVRGGRMRGVAKGVIAGNLFQILSDPRTRLVRVAGARLPGMLVDGHVTVG